MESKAGEGEFQGNLVCGLCGRIRACSNWKVSELSLPSPSPNPTSHLMATLILVDDENNNKTVANSILFQNCFDFPTDVDTSESAKDLMKRLICSAEVSPPSS